jgi:serine/threonine-protein kinase
MFLNRYVLLEPIGQGSVAVVYQAEDTLNNRQVAVKLLDPSLADNRRAQERLRHPAEMMSLLEDAGVPRMYEYGAAPLGDGAYLGYCVVELLTGEALDSRLLRGPLSWLDATRVAATVADVLTLAHAQNIALRVIEPTSVLLTADGAKIVDFDAAMFVVPAAPTPGPAPEPPASRSRRRRAAAEEPGRGRRADRGAVAIANLAADDVYALGALLDRMLGGTGPEAGLPAPLVELVLRCLAEPAHRPDAATLSMELWGMLTPGPTVPVASPLDDLLLPINARPVPGRHAAMAELETRAVLESRAAVESAAMARGALARAALDRPRPDHAAEPIGYTAESGPMIASPAASLGPPASPAVPDGATALLGGRAAALRDSATVLGRGGQGRPGGNGATAALGARAAARDAATAGPGRAAGSRERAHDRDWPHDRQQDGDRPRSRDRSHEPDGAGPQHLSTGPQHSAAGQGGRHRRRRPAWSGPTGQASTLS